jgi:hypothetical protein
MSSNEKFERDFESFLKGDDARLSALYRKLPQAEPDAKLDEAVLAMAHRALNPQLVATPVAARTTPARRRARWLPAFGVAASAVFAIGVAVKMAPRMWTEQRTAAPAAARDEGVLHVRPIDAPIPAPEPPMSPPPPTSQTAASGALAGPREATRAAAPKPAAPAAPAPELQKSAPPPPPPIAAEAAPLDRVQAKKVENVASPSPQAFPAQPARTSEMDAVERKEAIAEGAWHRLHDADATAPAGAAAAPRSTTATTAPQPIAEAPATRANAPASAGGAAAGLSAQTRSSEDEKSQALDTITVTGSHIRRVDVETASPVVTIDQAQKQQAEAVRTDKAARQEQTRPKYSPDVLRNAKLYPESWMSEIQRLLRQGRRDDARQNLTLFREKYPEYHLPPDIDRFAREQQ